MPFPDELEPSRLTRLYVGEETDNTPISTAEIETKIVRLDPITEIQRDSITAVDGMMCYNDDAEEYQGYANGIWVTLSL